MRERLRRHVRFEVAGDGNQDRVWAIEALSKETESKQAAQPKSQAPSPDPTTRPRLAAHDNSGAWVLWLVLQRSGLRKVGAAS
jgi:hypothetical protein